MCPAASRGGGAVSARRAPRRPGAGRAVPPWREGPAGPGEEEDRGEVRKEGGERGGGRWSGRGESFSS